MLIYLASQFAYIQLGTIIAMMVRRLELKIDAVPAHNYRVGRYFMSSVEYLMLIRSSPERRL